MSYSKGQLEVNIRTRIVVSTMALLHCSRCGANCIFIETRIEVKI